MDGFFGGANGAQGFVNYFDCVLEDTDRLYILKGGCGCGKSSLMRAVAAEALKRGETVELIYCASDPDSLDGVLLCERSIGIVDGTAPHERAPKYTGVVDSIVDLGEYLNTKKLRENREEVVRLSDKKAACYKRAYGLLAAAGDVREQNAAIVKEAVIWDKLAAAANRLALKQKGSEANIKLRPRTAFSFGGVAVAPEYKKTSLYAVHDPWDSARWFYRALLSACISHGVPVTLSPDCTSPRIIEALRMDGNGTLFCADNVENAAGVINMERFVDKDKLKKSRVNRKFLEKARQGLLAAAREALAEARACHSKLEEIYIPTMSFTRVDKRRNTLIKEIFA